MTIKLLGERLACGNVSVMLSIVMSSSVSGEICRGRAPAQGVPSHYFHCPNTISLSTEESHAWSTGPLFSSPQQLLVLAAVRMAQARHPILISFLSTHAVLPMLRTALQLSLPLKLFTDAYSLIHPASLFLPFQCTFHFNSTLLLLFSC